MADLVRVRRPCYDKPHRCPGWAGGGWKFPKTTVCERGYIRGRGEQRGWDFRVHRCPECKTLVLPLGIRWFDPSWYRWWVPFKVSDVAYELKWRMRRG